MARQSLKNAGHQMCSHKKKMKPQQLGLWLCKSGVVNYPVIIKNESCKSNSNQSYTIQAWSTKSSLWFWFKCQHPKFNIRQIEGLEINIAQGLTSQSCETFYDNLQSLYNKHNYDAHHIWISHKTEIQANKQPGVSVLAK